MWLITEQLGKNFVQWGDMNFTVRQIYRVRGPEAYDSVSVSKAGYMAMLAEAVILQAMEDLWSNFYGEESAEFFQGTGFSWYADIAGMSPYEKNSLLSLIKSPFTGRCLKNSEQ